MTIFDKAVNFVLSNEDGYCNNPNDKGGQTNFGISSKTISTLIDEPLSKIPINEITIEQAKQFYYKYYWVPGNFAALIYEPLAIKAFDMGVNMGIRRAIKILQQSYNILVPKDKIIQEDGKLGQKTADAVNWIPSLVIYNEFVSQCVEHYCLIAHNDTSQEIFLKGWIARAKKPIQG